jgi:hypothetical protein
MRRRVTVPARPTGCWQLLGSSALASPEPRPHPAPIIEHCQERYCASMTVAIVVHADVALVTSP